MSVPTSLENASMMPGARTVIEIDSPDFSLVQDPWWRSFRDLEITGSALRAGTSNIQFIPSIGYQLMTVHDQMSFVHEENTGVSVHHDIAGNLTKFTSNPIKTPPTLLGVPTGSQVQGDPFNQKNVTAGDDWGSTSYNLAADLAAFPKPPDEEIIPLDRIALGDRPMRPDQVVWFRLFVPGAKGGDAKGVIARLYFTSLSSSPNDDAEGTGQYALTLRADGLAFLWELSTSNTWVNRNFFSWSPPHEVSGAWHVIAIRSDAYLGDGHWHGSVINFQCQATSNFFEASLLLGTGTSLGTRLNQYVVPQTKAQNITQSPMRCDVRRDLRAKVSIDFTKFQTSGTLQTQTFGNPQKMGAVGGTDPVISVVARGSIAPGTSLDIQLHGADGASCGVAVDAVDNSEFVSRSFHRIDGQQNYYAIVTYTASADQTLSPAVNSFEVFRQGAIAEGASTPWTIPPTALLDLSLLGPGMDLRLETASMSLISLQDGFTVDNAGVLDPLSGLTGRRGQSVKVKLLLPTTLEPDRFSIQLIGKCIKLRRRRFGVKRPAHVLRSGQTASVYPSRTWWHGSMTMTGIWRRLMQAKATKTSQWAQKDPDTKENYRVTKIIKLLLANMGLPEKMLAIPNIDIKLLFAAADTKNNIYQTEVFSELLDAVLEWARDFLGASVQFDANATNGGGPSDENGCMLLKLPPRPDPATNSYLPVAKFVDDATWTDGSIRQKMGLNSYPPEDRGDGVFIPVCPVIAGTVELQDDPPDANWVMVAGTPITKSGGTLAASQSQDLLIRKIYNYPAAVFSDDQPIATDPNHPDYTDGSPNCLVVIDPNLTTPGSVEFAARRYFDFACHRRERMSFEAAGVVMVTGLDPISGIGTDPFQIRPRALTWGDPIVYNGVIWICSGCVANNNGRKGGSRNSTVSYEFFRIPQLMAINPDFATVYQPVQYYAPIASEAA